MKPGWKTSEAWLTLVSWVVTWIVANDVFASTPSAAKVAALIMSGLATLGYSHSRALVKGKDPGGN